VRRTDSMPDERIRWLHEAAQISLARDAATVEHPAAARCESILGGCPSCFVNEFPQHMVPVVEDGADALVSIRTPDLISVPIGLQMRVRDHIQGIIEALAERGYERIKLLCHDHRDIPFAASFSGVGYIYMDDVYAYLSLLRGARVNVSFRLHSALPCLSYGTPVVKISYDERGTSAMETVGFGDWNIDMVKEPDLIAAVEDRLDRLDDLERLREETTSVRAGQREKQVAAMDAFAVAVRERAA
jgi:hypothetical protein